MVELEKINPDESTTDSMLYIDSKRNWDVKKQAYKDEAAENCTANICDCKFYWRGQYLVVEYNDIIHYWEHGAGSYFKGAIDFFNLEKFAKWKTLDKLISLRQGIRQTEVNCCGYVEELLTGKKLTLDLYRHFMKLARAQDVAHHGESTF